MPALISARPVPVWLFSLALLALTAVGCESKPAPPAADDAAAADNSREASESDVARQEPGTTDEKPVASGTNDDTPPLPAPEAADGPETTDGAETADAAPAKVRPGDDPLVPAGMKRPTTEGWWRIVFSVNGNEFSAGFLEIAKNDAGKLAVQEIRTNSVINPAKLVRGEATDKAVRLFFEDGTENRFDFEGTLQDNVIRGNLQFLTQRQNLVRLVPIKESQATDEALDEQNLGPTFGVEPIVTALQSEDPVAGLRAVAKTWQNSPVLYMAYDVLFTQAKRLEIDRPTLDALAKEFEAVGRIWGERAEQAAKLNLAVDLMLTAYEADLARQKLDEVRKQNPELVEKWDDLLKTAERIVAIEEARQQLASGDAEAGLKALRELHAEQVTDAIAAYRLAVAEQEHGSKDEALRLFSRLAVIPQVEAELGQIPGEVDYTAPRTAAAKLYEEKNGNRDGFDEHLAGVYRETLTSFLTDEAKNRQPTESERTVMVELFTGAMCPPCVAADVATEAVAHSFPDSDVVVVRYHVNIPGPDPLSNSDSESRRDFYSEDFQGTPTVFIDGAKAPYNVGGPYSNAPVVYESLAETIAERAATPAGAKIDLSATAEGDVLHIAASASGIENPADSLRLRIAVAESDIDFSADNGIRLHEMVVREMPGGAAGVAAVDGEFSFEQDVPLVETRDRLVSYLDGFEGLMSQQSGQPFSFNVRPLGLRRLTVVAFLQDDATREILQTAVLPIEQDIELPALASRSTDAASPAAGESDDAEKTEGPSFAPQE